MSFKLKKSLIFALEISLFILICCISIINYIQEIFLFEFNINALISFIILCLLNTFQFIIAIRFTIKYYNVNDNIKLKKFNSKTIMSMILILIVEFIIISLLLINSISVISTKTNLIGTSPIEYHNILVFDLIKAIISTILFFTIFLFSIIFTIKYYKIRIHNK